MAKSAKKQKLIRKKTIGKSWISEDQQNVLLLIFLYLLQGIPLGLALGSVPLILQSKLSYREMALFALSSYPYSLKLLWSPIVDSVYIKSFGRRKSWIVPFRLTLIYTGTHIDELLEREVIPIVSLSVIFTTMVFLCATQDIAVDGWSVSLLTGDNKTYGSMAQTIGLNSGYFLSFTIFLAFNSADFCNKYLRSIPLKAGLFSLGEYIRFWGVMFLITNFLLILFKIEAMSTKKRLLLKHISIFGNYQRCLVTIFNLDMQSLYIILLIGKIGFITNDAITGLKLMELGFNKEYLALSVLLDFPLQLLFGYYTAKWCAGDRPLRPWIYGSYGRLITSLLSMIVVYYFPTNGVTSTYLFVVMSAIVCSSFMMFNNLTRTVQFVGIGSYFNRISDPSIGGTYMTLLNTLNNLGGTWPKPFIMLAVDYFTDAPCSVNDFNGLTIKCSGDIAKQKCLALRGKCSYVSDGYYWVNSACVIAGLLTMVFYVQPTMEKLEKMKDVEWRLKRDSKYKKII